MNDRFLITPNLPKTRVTAAAVGEKYTDTADELRRIGITPVIIKQNPYLDDEIACHADMLLFHKGKSDFILSKEQISASQILKNRGASVTFESGIASPYPNDVKLNSVCLGSRLIGNERFMSAIIANFARETNLNIINTKQGYAKCSVCVINKNAVMTEDDGIYTLLKKCQIDVLKLQPGYVYLSEKHFGFLGGASGLIAPDSIFFNGNLEAHPDFGIISAFLAKYGVAAVYNKSRRLTDIGSVIPLTEIAAD